MGLRQWLVERLGGEWPEPMFTFVEEPEFQRRGNVLVRCVAVGINDTEALLWEEEIAPPKHGETIKIRGHDVHIKWHLLAGDQLNLRRSVNEPS